MVEIVEDGLGRVLGVVLKTLEGRYEATTREHHEKSTIVRIFDRIEDAGDWIKTYSIGRP